LTGVWAEQNTRESLFAAFKARRVFATTGLRPDLRFTVSDAFMGSGIRVSGAPEVTVRVRCDVPVVRVAIVRNGKVVHQRRVVTRELDLSWRDATYRPGEYAYYAALTFAGDAPSRPWNLAPAYGIHAWSSPVWVNSTQGVHSRGP
jgi:hypothetical protein